MSLKGENGDRGPRSFLPFCQRGRVHSHDLAGIASENSWLELAQCLGYVRCVYLK